MTQPAQDWMTTAFLTSCLQHEENKENATVINFSASPAVPPGNNYGSSITRVKVEYKNNKDDKESHNLSLILKSELTEGPMKGVLTSEESLFYRNFLPQAGTITKTYFAPKCFYSPESFVVVLEDLKEQGFLMADKTKQLDFDHCRLYVDSAALFHAVSVAVHKEHPEMVECFSTEKMFANGLKQTEAMKRLMKSGFKLLVRFVEKSDKFKKYSQIVRETPETLWDMVVEAHKPRELNTLNQGDPWTTNMMFKYDDSGVVSQVKLLDYQAMRFASPANDLVFFIWTSANHDVRRNRLGDLYKIYLDCFNKRLEEFHCTERLTLDGLMDNIRLLSPLAIFIVGAMPFYYDNTPVDFEVFFKDDDDSCETLQQSYYNDNYCKNHLPKLLEEMELAGVFDYLEKYQVKK